MDGLNLSRARRSLLQTIAYNDFAQSQVGSSLSLVAQSNRIQQQLTEVGLTPYILPIYQNDLGVTCTRFLVPSVESFYLICTGKRVLPGPRGQQRLRV